MKNTGSDIKFIKGVGKKRAELLNKLGVFSSDDLFYFFPRTYEDWSHPLTVAEAPFDMPCCIKAKVITPIKENYIRKNMVIYKFIAEDKDGGTLYVSVFNNRYITKTVQEGKEYLFYGKADGNMLEKSISSPIIKPVGYEKMRPIYPSCEGLTSAAIEKIIGDALKGKDFLDFLPSSIKNEYKLCDLATAINLIHFPRNDNDVQIARRRLAFDELFIMQLGLKYTKERRSQTSGAIIENDTTDEFVSTLPFSLTAAQNRVIKECVKDMASGRQMNRLVQGDVGSGKTAVAASLIYHTVKHRGQAAMLAPTEILAEQHFKTFTSFFNGLNIKVALLTGATTKAEKSKIKEALSKGDIDLVVGTHALIEPDIAFKELELVVTDEQHRFGVEQKTKLSGKGYNPHMLYMSATPIPRSLALILYGDLDLSIIDEMPKGRQKIDTFSVDSSYRSRIYSFIKKNINEGHQAYIVCPMIDENDSNLVAVKEYYNELKNGEFSSYNVGLLHGKMKSKEKDAVMKDFATGKIQLLISTTVIEVGIDVPNATVMVIENAERFGLSQLHQLRGRIGRGSDKSTCILVSSNKGEIPERLSVLTKTGDGMKIADEDLKLRGPGDFLGKRQHGLPNMKIADISSDIELIKSAGNAASEILKIDGKIEFEEHIGIRKRVAKFLRSVCNYGYN